MLSLFLLSSCATSEVREVVNNTATVDPVDKILNQKALIKTNRSGNQQFYHMYYLLADSNIVDVPLINKDSFKLDGGQFEITLNSTQFPITAPNCRSELILRMPWTDNSLPNADQLINEKFRIYQLILDLKNNDKAPALKVSIELNPYVKVENGNYLLTQCNIFFRSAKGGYIPNTDRLL
jgi:hypothetical protein